jgi:hypothetical protein
VEQADLGRGPDVGAAAQLPGDALDLDHPHPVAVLLTEEGHRPEALGLVAGGLERANRMALRDPGRHTRLHVGQLGSAHSLTVSEVEAQLVRADVGAGLAHVRAEALA